MAEHHSWNTVELEQLNPNLARQCIHTEKITLARIVLKKGCVVPEHHHESEQFSHVVEGELRFYIGGREIVVHAGEVITIPSNVPHRAVAFADTLEFDVFTPPRQDWINKDDAYLRNDTSNKASS